MKKLILFLSLLGMSPAFAVQGVYVGGEVGSIQLTDPTHQFYNNAIGYGVDLGLRASPFIDVTFSSQMSSHSGLGDGLKLYGEFVGANVHLDLVDFDIMFGAGPGFYFYNTTASTTSEFGLHFDTAIDVLVSDSFRVGLGYRYHGVFNADDYWTVMMRFGFNFQM